VGEGSDPIPGGGLKSADEVYAAVDFPAAPASRPFCYINMVTTIDGKILSGSRDDHVLDLGSKTDHVLMKRLEAYADGVMVGAQTLRVGPKGWTPLPRVKIVVSKSGDLPFDAGFLSAPGAWVATTDDSPVQQRGGVQVIRAGRGTVDLSVLFDRLRKELGIQRLLVLGGSELNAQLLASDLVDELFVTIAPKVKLGRDVPTYADGDSLPREKLQQYSLVEHHAIGDELFIRYRRKPNAGQQVDA
jgi:riboflavin biosynthesis pyrimidine reductase